MSASLAAALALAGTACGAGAASSTSAAQTPASSATAVATSSPTESASRTASATATATAAATATATAASASSPAAAGSACTSFAAAHTFLRLATASENTDGSLTVTGNRATMVCGGPDDFHYDFAATVTGRVTPSGSVQVLSTSLQDTPTTHAKFPAYLKTDQNIRVFVYTGPLTAITSLAEQFHP